MKKQKMSPKRKIADWFETIFVILLIGSSVYCIIGGLNQVWIGFFVCLAIAIISIIIVIPLHYYGIVYTCPKCGQQFRANPYKVFFTNLVYIDFLTAYSPKRKKLKCPHCQSKAWCSKDNTEISA